jgi:hypothetical protein
MCLRDEVEKALRAWDRYEAGRGGRPVIDYDCYPSDNEVEPAGSRLAVLYELERLSRGPVRPTGLFTNG